jgi:hypothetical protein
LDFDKNCSSYSMYDMDSSNSGTTPLTIKGLEMNGKGQVHILVALANPLNKCRSFREARNYLMPSVQARLRGRNSHGHSLHR